MTNVAAAAWRGDPYRRHELRYWDGLAWTPHVVDFGATGYDPVFPVPDGDGRPYLAVTRTRRRRSRNVVAASLAISGFVAVVSVATVSAVAAPEHPALPRTSTSVEQPVSPSPNRG
jgi:hypothetical protein